MKKKLVLLFAAAAVSAPAWTQEQAPGLWAGVDLGMGSVKSLAPAPSAGRDALAVSVDLGYRLTPQWGLGLEYGTVVPVNGCAGWQCAAGNPATFAPRFTRLMAIGEFRPRDSGWRFRAGAGLSTYCYSRHWSDTAWSWGDTLELLLNDETEEALSGSGAWRCDGRSKALGGEVSVGYDWPVSASRPVAVGLRLRAEAANFGTATAIGLPAFRHRALTLTLHLNFN